ncbi:MAG: thiamine pyrophosphate-binding protein [Xanthobacteraceae bacterium]
MNGAAVIAEILKRDGTEFLSCYPRNPLIEASAALDIRPILCRQERVGVGIADGYSRGKRDGRQGPASRTLSRALRRPFLRMSRCWLSLAAFRSSRNMCSQFSAPPTFFDR